MKREFYSESIPSFLEASPETILGRLSDRNNFSLEQPQKEAWLQEIQILKKVLQGFKGFVYLEYSIPRMGQRIDAVLLIESVIFVLEFKVGENTFTSYAKDQVWDYALDLKNFHETSHNHFIAPILIATKSKSCDCIISTTPQNDKVLFPINSNVASLAETIKDVLKFCDGPIVNAYKWENGRYNPTPTIIEAARALYNGHSVHDISRSDAGAKNLTNTTDLITDIIKSSKDKKQKSICFVTGVPGSGKTLVGLNIATIHPDEEKESYSVFLSGNGPLVRILREALVRDKVKREKQKGNDVKKGQTRSKIKSIIQNIHHFRDDCLIDTDPPFEHVAIFDEAQRAWNLDKTIDFMRRKKKISDFQSSEPEFLISCLNRHQDWAVIVCLVGGGQEIHLGEAGIGEWIDSLNRSFSDWHIYLSSRLTDSEYGSGKALTKLQNRPNVTYKDELHLSVSMRSFRAENVSLLIKQILDLEKDKARSTFKKIKNYPIVITRNLQKAKRWLREKARGSERYGMVVSSQAERLKPHAIDVKSPMNPVHWFLNDKDDVRASYYLEQVATEFQIQGLELDWACVTWDADFRFSENGWVHKSFRGNRWQNIIKPERKNYLKNAYRVLLTRARQGMVIVVPSGNTGDHTRDPKFYNSTYKYLKSIGFPEI